MQNKFKLSELGIFKNGANYPKGSYGKGDKIVNVKDLFKGRIVNENELDELKRNTLKNREIYLVEDGDILFTRSSLVRSGAGMCAMIKQPIQDILFCGFIIRYRVNKEMVYPLYLLYLLRSPQYRKLFTEVQQTNITNINQDSLGDIEVYLPIDENGNPDIIKQREIVEVLDKIDLKIENNNKIISELEQMAKMIYDYWFLQYEFPNEEGKPYKSSGGKMVCNDELKKEIPEGWEYKKIVEIEDNIVTGKTPSTKDETNFGGEIPFITIDDIRKGLYVSKTVRTLSERGANLQIKKYIPKDSICVTCIATVGLVGITTRDSQTNQQINSIVCKDKKNLYYLVNVIKDYFKYSSGAKSGNIFDNMNKEDFVSIKLIYPTEDVLEKYKEKIEPIYNKIKSCILENEKLVELRDFLLPVLMNGQVGFKD